MIEIIAYEMKFVGNVDEEVNINLELFKDEFYEEYEKVHNECFFEMRKALDVKPYNFYSSIDQIEDKKQNIYILFENNKIIGSVYYIVNDIDDLIVNKRYQNKGIGKQLLLWAIKNIRKYSEEPIYLHVAKWNENAIKLYLNNGFEISKIEKIR